LPSIPGGQAFLEAMDGFIETWGQREGSCWYLSTPTWRQDQMQVWRILASLVMVDHRRGRPDEARARFLAARERVMRGLRFYPGLGRLFTWLLERLRALHCFREQSHFDLAMPLDALQQIARLWGSRLMERGVLVCVDDVFFLTYEEVRAWLLDGLPDADEARNLIARRRATYRVVDSRWQEERTKSGSTGPVIRGVGVSAGVARARARVVMDEGQFNGLLPGEVLVCPHTNPSWTPLFSGAAAVVSETGGVASHAAIVAREYGIPAVMAATGATNLLEDGQELLVDGSRGTVRRCESFFYPNRKDELDNHNFGEIRFTKVR
jgi:pyruvate,water dikinase